MGLLNGKSVGASVVQSPRAHPGGRPTGLTEDRVHLHSQTPQPSLCPRTSAERALGSDRLAASARPCPPRLRPPQPTPGPQALALKPCSLAVLTGQNCMKTGQLGLCVELSKRSLCRNLVPINVPDNYIQNLWGGRGEIGPLFGLLLVLEGVPAGSSPLGSCTACMYPTVPQSEPEERRKGPHAS